MLEPSVPDQPRKFRGEFSQKMTYIALHNPYYLGPTIIYCPSRKDVEKVSEDLESHGIENQMYHAGNETEF